jgi:hypothetical protein
MKDDRLVRHKSRFFPVVFFTAALLYFSCASVKEPGGKPDIQEVLLPLKAGWYQYDSDRTWKGIEDERNFELSTGMKMVMETTWKYTGVVCRFEDDVLFDPVSEIELLIDREGRISCAENISIRGSMEKDGRFFWCGVKEEHGRLQSIFVKGTLLPLPPSGRGGREFEGVYRLRHAATDREILANISDGFYTWKYLDEEDAGFSPWPTLIKPDGSFGFSIEISTVAKMGELISTNMSTRFSAEGKVIPGLLSIPGNTQTRRSPRISKAWSAPAGRRYKLNRNPTPRNTHPGILSFRKNLVLSAPREKKLLSTGQQF